MEKSYHEVTNIVHADESNIWFMCDIGGSRYKVNKNDKSNFGDSLKKAIDDGATVGEFVLSPEIELAELDQSMPRYIEDLLDVMPEDQKTAYLAMDTKFEGKDKGWVKTRKATLRGMLQ